jgi:hypothetical protein
MTAQNVRSNPSVAVSSRQEMPMAKTGKADTESMEARLVAFAEQIGRIAGTVRAKADGALDPQAIRDELQRVKDRAADLLEQLAGSDGAESTGQTIKKRMPQPSAKSKGRSGGVVDAPGKKHRKPTPNQKVPYQAAASRRRSVTPRRTGSSQS